MFRPKYTMNGFELHDQRGIEGTGYVRALRSLLTAHLPVLLPTLRKVITEGYEAELTEQKIIDGKTCLPTINKATKLDMRLTLLGWIHCPTFPMAKRIVAKANSFMFFGEQLCTSFLRQ